MQFNQSFPYKIGRFSTKTYRFFAQDCSKKSGQQLKRASCPVHGIGYRVPHLGSCSLSSFRNAIPITFRLPRRFAPHNDMKLERLSLENNRFGRIQSFSIKTSVPFFRKTDQVCHCEEGACAPDAVIFDAPAQHSVTKYGEM